MEKNNGFPKYATTDSEGKARFQVEYGDYVVNIDSEDYVSKSQPVQFRSNHKNFTIPVTSIDSCLRLKWNATTQPTVGFYGNQGLVLSDGATATIKWGDGTVSSYSQPSDFAHTYEQEGTFDILIIPENGHITGLGNDLFKNCSGLEMVVMPSTITDVGSGAFSSCVNLKGVGLSDSLTEIKTGVFSNCTSLNQIDLPSGITTIGDGSFQRCAFSIIQFPQSLTQIGIGAFSDCSNLSTITFNEGLVTIKNGCFSTNALRNVVIPSTVTTLGGGSFTNNANLTSVQFLSPTPPSVYGAFDLGTRMTATVPKGTLEAYTSALSSYYYITIIEKE